MLRAACCVVFTLTPLHPPDGVLGAEVVRTIAQTRLPKVYVRLVWMKNKVLQRDFCLTSRPHTYGKGAR